MPRKPTAQLALSGSLNKHPERLAARANEPKPDPKFGNAPTHLTKAQKKVWKEVVDQIPDGVATKADRLVVEVVVRMTEKMREGTATSANYTTLMRGLSQLGMTPADRSKISVTPQESDATESDPFAEFTTKEFALDPAQAN